MKFVYPILGLAFGLACSYMSDVVPGHDFSRTLSLLGFMATFMSPMALLIMILFRKFEA